MPNTIQAGFMSCNPEVQPLEGELKEWVGKDNVTFKIQIQI
jgi:hypothetical protein